MPDAAWYAVTAGERSVVLLHQGHGISENQPVRRAPRQQTLTLARRAI
jgi:hypothetical protein